MFCPKCGKPMEDMSGLPWCAAGDMQLSVAAERQIREVFFSEEPGAATALAVGTLSEYFCPRCGCNLHESSGRLQCPTCGSELPGSLRHRLVELHPHKNWPRTTVSLADRLRAKRARLGLRNKWGV